MSFRLYRGATSTALSLAGIFAFQLAAAGGTAGAASQATPAKNLCGAPLSPGPIVEPPQIEMSSLPLSDRGQHELVLNVVRAGDRFCYRYALDGVAQSAAPILRVHPGETFAVRIVDELHGAAPGATMAASALAPCKPQSMPDMMPHEYVGYMNHLIESRMMSVPDVDVNLHFHGFEGSPLQDDVFLSALTTPAHACEYELTVPLTQPPGTYFYHPHAHGMADDEVAGGLSGMWIVESDTPELPASDDHAIILKYRIPFVINNRFLPSTAVLTHAADERERALAPAAPVNFDPFDPPPWPSVVPMSAADQRLEGVCGSRKGVALAVDGVDVPGELTVPAGEPQRLRVLNAMSDTVTYLRMRDASGRDRPLRIVARDGIPVGGDDAHPLARYVSQDEAPLVPSGRVDLLVTLQPGDVLTLRSAHHCAAPYDEFQLSQDLLVIRAGAPLSQTTTLDTAPLLADQTPAMQLVTYARAHPNLVRRRALTYTEYGLPDPRGHGYDGAYFLTETSDPNFHEHQYWPRYAKGARVPRPDIVVKRGTIEEWYLFNTTMEVHTFHIHQMSFVAEDGSGGPVTLDTALVPFGTMLPNPKNPGFPLIKPSRTRVLLDFRHVPRGTFLFHCHMLFHEDGGMMGVIRVE